MKVQRKSYLINKQYQFGLLWLLLLIVFIAIFISIAATHYFFLSAIVTKVEETGTFPSGNELAETAVKPLIIIVPIVFIVLAFTFIYIIFVSHHTAGPLYHLKRAMEKVGEGDLSVQIKFRNHDEIHDVAESFNKMVMRLKQKYGGAKAKL